MNAKLQRCRWVDGNDPLYVSYHDEEWGVPVHNDQTHFELLTLEGAQAGLSWITILRKREGYRRAFHQFDPLSVARMGAEDVARLVLDETIVRHRAKIESTLKNARAFLALQAEEGSFDAWIWNFVEGQPLINTWSNYRDAPASTALSTKVSKELKRRGFGFLGPTTVYAYFQAAGLVSDHESDCFRA